MRSDIHIIVKINDTSGLIIYKRVIVILMHPVANRVMHPMFHCFICSMKFSKFLAEDPPSLILC